mmetsp:Transcript_53672/g.165089  ORF Transcript_53672/g.165089 Transcript_53672/m.165089 type:complete len:401 (-) Transcript_53672:89-1291(-)
MPVGFPEKTLKWERKTRLECRCHRRSETRREPEGSGRDRRGGAGEEVVVQGGQVVARGLHRHGDAEEVLDGAAEDARGLRALPRVRRELRGRKLAAADGELEVAREPREEQAGGHPHDVLVHAQLEAQDADGGDEGDLDRRPRVVVEDGHDDRPVQDEGRLAAEVALADERGEEGRHLHRGHHEHGVAHGVRRVDHHHEGADELGEREPEKREVDNLAVVLVARLAVDRAADRRLAAGRLEVLGRDVSEDVPEEDVAHAVHHVLDAEHPRADHDGPRAEREDDGVQLHLAVDRVEAVALARDAEFEGGQGEDDVGDGEHHELLLAQVVDGVLVQRRDVQQHVEQRQQAEDLVEVRQVHGARLGLRVMLLTAKQEQAIVVAEQTHGWCGFGFWGLGSGCGF